MTDPIREVKVITPTDVVKSTGQRLTAADLQAMDRVPDGLMPDRPIVINVVQDAPGPGYRGDDLLRRFVPYFVITMMGLVIVGGIAAILGLVIPVIMSFVLSIVASFVSIIMSLVATIIAGVVVALAITYLQSTNDRRGKIK